MIPRLREELGRFGPIGRRRVLGYLGLAWLVTLMYLGCQDDLGELSRPMVQVRGVQYLLCALIFHLGLAAVVVFVAAAAKRAWAVALLCVPVIGISVAPEVPFARLMRSEGDARRPLSILSVNVLMVNRDVAPILAEIEAARPDVLLVQEYAPQWHAALHKAMAGYAYAGVVREDSFGAAVYSRIPFRGTPRVDVKLGTWDLPQMRIVLGIGDRGVALYNVHLVPPRNTDYVEEHRRQLRDLVGVLRGERLPTVVAGDFNFTPRMPQATHIDALGLSDVHQLSYPGRHSTWPVIDAMRYVPGIALDHVFVSRDVHVVRSTIGTGTGSDHRPLGAVLAVP